MRMMKMKNKLVFAPMVQLIILMLGVKDSGQTTTSRPRTTTTTTTGHPALNLKGKMFTLSLNGGDLSFYSAYFSPPSSTPSYRTPGYTTTTSPGPSWTTASPHIGVSVCLRYITDYLRTRSPSIFTLSPSTNPLYLKILEITKYSLSLNDYNYLYLAPSVRFWPNIRSDFWTSICLTVDSSKNVAQVFSGANMSIRKVLPFQYVWSGEPVINFSGFDGQVTDVQVWDYPLRFGEIYNYMTYGAYGPYRGSVLSWSYVSYSMRGNTLLEDAYEWQAKQPIVRKGRGQQTKKKRKTRRFFTEVEDVDKQQL